MDNPIDVERPVLQSGQQLCGACWTVGEKGKMQGWAYFNFEKLEATWVCSRCLPTYVENFSELLRVRL